MGLEGATGPSELLGTECEGSRQSTSAVGVRLHGPRDRYHVRASQLDLCDSTLRPANRWKCDEPGCAAQPVAALGRHRPLPLTPWSLMDIRTPSQVHAGGAAGELRR